MTSRVCHYLDKGGKYASKHPPGNAATVSGCMIPTFSSTGFFSLTLRLKSFLGTPLVGSSFVSHLLLEHRNEHG
jgi:hypothetical protein